MRRDQDQKRVIVIAILTFATTLFFAYQCFKSLV